jgi:hypothetical protein
MMAYDLSDDGKIITLSKLDRFYIPSKVLDLPIPNSRIFNFSQTPFKEEATIITDEDVERGSFEVIKKILTGDSDNVFWNVSEYGEKHRHIEENIKLHQSSKNLPSSVKEAGLRNVVVHKINKVLRSPAVQYNMTVPVDEAMSDLKQYIPKSNLIEQYS